MAGDDERGTPDMPSENGKRPTFRKPIDERLGAIGTGGGYSGQEYDSAGQDAWRRTHERQNVDASGAVHGTGVGAGGAPGEDFDDDTANGGAAPPTGSDADKPD